MEPIGRMGNDDYGLEPFEYSMGDDMHGAGICYAGRVLLS